MFLLLLRVVTAPMIVLGATHAQRRFGHAVSGMLVGLPLSTMALLWLVGLQHGAGFTASMAGSILAATSAQVVVLLLYARLALRYSPSVALFGTLVAFVAVASPFIFLNLSSLIASALALGATVVALQLWPSTSATSTEGGRYRLGLRLLIASVVTVLVVTLSGRVGPSLTGLMGALPVMSLTMAYVTHREIGAQASAQFLKGVTRGSYSYVLAMLALTEVLRSGAVALAFLVALAVALVTQVAVRVSNDTTWIRRVLVYATTSSKARLSRLAPENFRAVWLPREHAREALANS